MDTKAQDVPMAGKTELSRDVFEAWLNKDLDAPAGQYDVCPIKECFGCSCVGLDEYSMPDSAMIALPEWAVTIVPRIDDIAPWAGGGTDYSKITRRQVLELLTPSPDSVVTHSCDVCDWSGDWSLAKLHREETGHKTSEIAEEEGS